MPSAIEVANLGLVSLGERPISSFDDGGTITQVIAGSSFHGVMREVLVLYPWADASARASLPALAEAPAWGWTVACAMPADCLVIRAVDGVARSGWAIEGRTIVTDAEAPLAVFYTRDLTLDPVTGVKKGDGDDLAVGPLLARVIGLRFAVHIAEAITGTIDRTQLADTKYQRALIEARAADAIMSRPFVVRDELA